MKTNKGIMHKENLKPDFLSELCKEDQLAIIQIIDESPYSWNEWERALNFFNAWLSQNQLTLTLLNQIRYIECCIEGANSLQGQFPLIGLVEDYLNTYGVKN